MSDGDRTMARRLLHSVLALSLVSISTVAYAQALHPVVASVQAALATACAQNAAGGLINPDACLAEVQASIAAAAPLDPLNQGRVGLIICDHAEANASVFDAIVTLVQSANIVPLASGCQVALATPGFGDPRVISPA